MLFLLRPGRTNGGAGLMLRWWCRIRLCGEARGIGDINGEESRERFVRKAGTVKAVNRRGRDELEGVNKFKRGRTNRLRPWGTAMVRLTPVEIMSVLGSAIIGFECLEPCWPGFRCWPHDDGDLEREGTRG